MLTTAMDPKMADWIGSPANPEAKIVFRPPDIQVLVYSLMMHGERQYRSDSRINVPTIQGFPKKTPDSQK